MRRIICTCLLMFNLILLSSCNTYNMEKLPEGELLYSEYSETGAYRIDVFLCSGNATTDFSIRCAVVEVETGESRNIYWQYKEEDAEVTWIDENTVDINGVVLDIHNDSYDWREK